MRLIAFGGDARMDGAAEAARRAGWEAMHIRAEADVPGESLGADAALLPWPYSFKDEQLAGGEMSKERTLELLRGCGFVLHGGGVDGVELPEGSANPAGDEVFLRENAELTAEGAICRAMQRPGAAIMGATCVITGFGRIGQALARRLCALSAFVIVCARNEAQMRAAHDMGAHPVPLAAICSALRHADVVFNTVPARVLGWEELRKMRKGVLLIELASPPYGADPALAMQMGVSLAMESGVPGRYAPGNAGAALFAALQRAMARQEEKREAEKREAGGDADG